MGITKAKTAGTCSKCRGKFEAGEDIGVEKGKPPLCSKCAPKNTKTFSGSSAPRLMTREEIAFKTMLSMIERKPNLEVGSLVLMTFKIADTFIAERDRKK